MKKFISIPVVESGIYVFGGHMHTVQGGWSFFEQEHQAFELMCILKGEQTTEIKGLAPMTYGPGSIIIISPGSIHTNRNASKTESLTYICFHFNFESLHLKSAIITDIANTVITSENPIAKASMQTALDIIKFSKNVSLDKEQTNLKIQITILTYLYKLSGIINDSSKEKHAHFTEREAKAARNMATLIEESIENIENIPFSFGDICKQMGISNGYGHRTFKKVYGVTPLHFIEEKKFRKAKLFLECAEYSVEDVALMLGSSTISNFSKQFKKWSGITPNNYRKQINRRRTVRSVSQSGYFE
ncbi:MAG TPA: AraC family transcriptional regulator [Weissella thailandensis]|uniref:helix-turn-helix domain-containing protein n=1 Tax=Weissella thailandensis TaxID=89061 RepID=UPI001D40A12A|nr:AraC family transcriptional regulator [Weissella thailandensis]HJG85387.1 AraC family transcriptional regulator [Weissella thailandensis]HJH01712.1 AraC family transcriptional regulator [Aerococcus urinaeequi]